MNTAFYTLLIGETFTYAGRTFRKSAARSFFEPETHGLAIDCKTNTEYRIPRNAICHIER